MTTCVLARTGLTLPEHGAPRDGDDIMDHGDDGDVSAGTGSDNGSDGGSPQKPDGETSKPMIDGRQTWVYSLRTAFGQRWVGWPLASVLQRVTADSGGRHTFNHLRAYRKARVASKLGLKDDDPLTHYHGFSVTRTHKDHVDWAALRGQPGTIVVVPPDAPSPAGCGEDGGAAHQGAEPCSPCRCR